MPRMNLQDRYKKAQDAVAAAAAKTRRSLKDIVVIAVTKTASTDQIKQLVELGHHDLAESRVQQLQQRTAQIDEWLARQQARKAGGLTEKNLPAPGSLRWHMIGHLQRNKVRAVMGLCSVIHSVDSLRLAEEIQEEAERMHAQPPAAPAGAVPG